MRFRRQAPGMYGDDDTGNVLDDVARIHPAVARLRQLLASATILDLKATTDTYWASRVAEDSAAAAADTA
jgi:hypothetical protein